MAMKAYRERKPWVAALIGLILGGPEIGMFYLNKGRVGIGYLIARYVIAITFIATNPFHLFIPDALYAPYAGIIPINIIGSIHCFCAAKKFDLSIQLKWFARWWGLLSILLIPVTLTLPFRIFFFEPFTVPASSMSPTLNPGDGFFVKKFDLHLQRADLIAFKAYGTSYVKRIVGLPGDTIKFVDSDVYINGTILRKQNIGNFTVLSLNGDKKDYEELTETSPEGQKYKILGHTKESCCNHMMGDGETFVVPIHHYFVVGDNRFNSVDSRDKETIGFIADESIIGKAVLVYWRSNQGLVYQPIN